MNREYGKLLSCPFTWSFNEISSEKCKFNDNGYEEESVENDLITLMYLISSIYHHAVNNNKDKIYENLQKLLNYWETFDYSTLQHKKVSVNVVGHIIEATKYFVLNKMGNALEAKKIINNIIDSDNFKSDTELATLYGCESIAKFYLDDDEYKGAILLAKRAISQNQDCPMWHFILGKYLRKCRRYQRIHKPSEDEKKALLKSYELSKDPDFGIHVAQMYRENQEYHKSDEMYIKIYNLKPLNPRIQLRLALGFTRKNDFTRAKDCFDNAEKYIPNDSTFLHYKGIYFKKTKNYADAIKYLKKATELGNFAADIEYAKCMMYYNKNFNYARHLRKMLDKYKGNTYYEQNIKLLMVMHFYYYEKNLEEASSCILDAILINPKSDMLKKFFNDYESKTINIYNFISNTLIPECKQEFPSMSPEMQDILEKLKNIHQRR